LLIIKTRNEKLLKAIWRNGLQGRPTTFYSRYYYNLCLANGWSRSGIRQLRGNDRAPLVVQPTNHVDDVVIEVIAIFFIHANLLTLLGRYNI